MMCAPRLRRQASRTILEPMDVTLTRGMASANSSKTGWTFSGVRHDLAALLPAAWASPPRPPRRPSPRTSSQRVRRKTTARSYSREDAGRRARGRRLFYCHLSLRRTVCALPADHGSVNPDSRLRAQLAHHLLRSQRLIQRGWLTRAPSEQGNH